jgi:hypothetical protein
VTLLKQCTIKGVTVCLPSEESPEQIENQLGALNIPVQIVSLPDRNGLNSYLNRHELGAFQRLLPKAELAKRSTACCAAGSKRHALVARLYR